MSWCAEKLRAGERFGERRARSADGNSVFCSIARSIEAFHLRLSGAGRWHVKSEREMQSLAVWFAFDPAELPGRTRWRAAC